MDGLDTGSPPRLHCLGRIRTESSDDSREHLWAFWRRAKIQARRPGFAVGFAALLALRTDVICGIFGSKRGAAIRLEIGRSLTCGHTLLILAIRRYACLKNRTSEGDRYEAETSITFRAGGLSLWRAFLNVGVLATRRAAKRLRRQVGSHPSDCEKRRRSKAVLDCRHGRHARQQRFSTDDPVSRRIHSVAGRRTDRSSGGFCRRSFRVCSEGYQC